MKDEITYPFPNCNGSTVEVWEWIINFILHFIMDLITYPCHVNETFLTWSLLILGICMNTNTWLSGSIGASLMPYPGHRGHHPTSCNSAPWPEKINHIRCMSGEGLFWKYYGTENYISLLIISYIYKTLTDLSDLIFRLEIFQENYINAQDTDALDPCITR